MLHPSMSQKEFWDLNFNSEQGGRLVREITTASSSLVMKSCLMFKRREEVRTKIQVGRSHRRNVNSRESALGGGGLSLFLSFRAQHDALHTAKQMVTIEN